MWTFELSISHAIHVWSTPCSTSEILGFVGNTLRGTMAVTYGSPAYNRKQLRKNPFQELCECCIWPFQGLSVV